MLFTSMYKGENRLLVHFTTSVEHAVPFSLSQSQTIMCPSSMTGGISSGRVLRMNDSGLNLPVIEFESGFSRGHLAKRRSQKYGEPVV